MSNKEFAIILIGIFAVLGVFVLAAYVGVNRDKTQAEITKTIAVERAKVEQGEKTKRTKERMKMIPWYKSSAKGE